MKKIEDIYSENEDGAKFLLYKHRHEIIALVKAAKEVDVSSQGLYGKALVDALAAFEDKS